MVVSTCAIFSVFIIIRLARFPHSVAPSGKVASVFVPFASVLDPSCLAAWGYFGTFQA